MKTKELSEKNFHVFLNIEAPKNINTKNITSQEVQAALSNFFQQSPQILFSRQMFLKKTFASKPV
jgi:hypothetical protein